MMLRAFLVVCLLGLWSRMAASPLSSLYENQNPAFAAAVITQSLYRQTLEAGYGYYYDPDDDGNYIESIKGGYSAPDAPYEGVFLAHKDFVAGVNAYFGVQSFSTEWKTQKYEKENLLGDASALISHKIGRFYWGGQFFFHKGEVDFLNGAKTLDTQSYQYRFGLGWDDSYQLKWGLTYQNFYRLEKVRLMGELETDLFFDKLPCLFGVSQEFSSIWNGYSYGNDLSGELPLGNGKVYDFNPEMHVFQLQFFYHFPFGSITTHFVYGWLEGSATLKAPFFPAPPDFLYIYFTDQVHLSIIDSRLEMDPLYLDKKNRLLLSAGINFMPYTSLQRKADLNLGGVESEVMDYKLFANRYKYSLKALWDRGEDQYWLAGDCFFGGTDYYDQKKPDPDLDARPGEMTGYRISLGTGQSLGGNWKANLAFQFIYVDYPTDLYIEEWRLMSGLSYEAGSYLLILDYYLNYRFKFFDARALDQSLRLQFQIPL